MKVKKVPFDQMKTFPKKSRTEPKKHQSFQQLLKKTLPQDQKIIKEVILITQKTEKPKPIREFFLYNKLHVQLKVFSSLFSFPVSRIVSKKWGKNLKWPSMLAKRSISAET